MSDPMIRLVVVVSIIGLVLAAADAVRRGVAIRRRPIVMKLPVSGLVLFSSDGCSSCDRVRAALAEACSAEVTVMDWDSSPEVFLTAGIERVPTLVRVDERGVGWMASGVPSARRVRKWLGDP